MPSTPPRPTRPSLVRLVRLRRGGQRAVRARVVQPDLAGHAAPEPELLGREEARVRQGRDPQHVRSCAAPQHPARVAPDRDRSLGRSGADAEGRPAASRVAPTLAVGLLPLHARRPADLVGHVEHAVSAGRAPRARLRGASCRRGARCHPGSRDRPVDDPGRAAAEERARDGRRQSQGRPLGLGRRYAAR